MQPWASGPSCHAEVGIEEQRMMTTLFEAPSFSVGTRLAVAVRPDLGTARAVQGSRQR